MMSEYTHTWTPIFDCPLHISSKWGQIEEPSPPIEPPTTQELRERRDARIRAAINVCIENGFDIMHLVFNTNIPAGALLDIWEEEVSRPGKYHGKDLTIRLICKLRRINKGK